MTNHSHPGYRVIGQWTNNLRLNVSLLVIRQLSPSTPSDLCCGARSSSETVVYVAIDVLMVQVWIWGYYLSLTSWHSLQVQNNFLLHAVGAQSFLCWGAKCSCGGRCPPQGCFHMFKVFTSLGSVCNWIFLVSGQITLEFTLVLSSFFPMSQIVFFFNLFFFCKHLCRVAGGQSPPQLTLARGRMHFGQMDRQFRAPSTACFGVSWNTQREPTQS